VGGGIEPWVKLIEFGLEVDSVGAYSDFLSGVKVLNSIGLLRGVGVLWWFWI
jgi:hypothetical protein